MFIFVLTGTKYDLDTTDELPSISIAMFHKGTYSVSEVPLGALTVHLDHVDPAGQVTEQSYPLELSGRMKTVSGEVDTISIV